MDSVSTENAEKAIRKYYRKFVLGLCTRLVDLIEKRECKHNSTPELNIIAQAVLTLSYIFRIKYRHTYFNVQRDIVDSKYFSMFCDDHFQREHFPCFLAFLLNVSRKFEFFLYVREAGHNYFDIFVTSLLNYPDYLIFVLLGGAERLSRVSWFLLDITKDMQILVNTESPCRRKLLSFEESIQEIESKFPELSRKRSFNRLRRLSQDFYSGLQKYEGEMVLPFLILRFLLDGKVPYTGTPDKFSVMFRCNRDYILHYFANCLTKEVMSGEAYQGRTRTELRISLGIQQAYEYHTSLHVFPSANEPQKTTLKEWIPIINHLSDDDRGEDVDSDIDFVAHITQEIKNAEAIYNNMPNEEVAKEYNNKPKEDVAEDSDSDFASQNEINKAKDCHANVLDNKIPSLETVSSSEEKAYGNGLEWLKCFNDKTVSLLNSENLDSVEDNSSEKACIPLSESVAETSSSVKHNLGARPKDFVGQKKKETKRMKAKKNNANLSRGQNLALITQCSSDDEDYSNAAEDNSSKNICTPFGKNSTEISSNKGCFGAWQKVTPAKFVTIEEPRSIEELTSIEPFSHIKLNSKIKLSSQKVASAVIEFKKRNRRKQELKAKNGKKPEPFFFKFEEKPDPIKKLKDNLISTIKRTKNLFSWEKKCIFFFVDRAEKLTMQEKVSLCTQVENVPRGKPKEYADAEQMVEQEMDLMVLDVKSELLNIEYVRNKGKNEPFIGEIPFPEFTGNMRGEFIELLIRLLAISCDRNIHAAMLGQWVPFLQNILQRNKSLVSQISVCGPNDFLQLLSDHAFAKYMP